MARREFEQAQALRPHPVIRYNLALCWVRLGKPTAAVTELRQVLSDPGTDSALRARSEGELRLAEQAAAHVRVSLPDPERDQLELDGKLLPTVAPELELDPGLHHVRITSGGLVVLDQDLELAPSEQIELRVGQRSRRIDVIVVPTSAPTPTPSPPASAPRAAPAPHETAARGVPRTWFFVAAGSSALLAGLTIWSGLDTTHAHSEYERRLPSLNQAEADRLVSEGHGRELRTNLLLSGSLLTAAGSAVLGLWLVDWGESVQAGVAMSPSGLGVSGRF